MCIHARAKQYGLRRSLWLFKVHFAKRLRAFFAHNNRVAYEAWRTKCVGKYCARKRNFYVNLYITHNIRSCLHIARKAIFLIHDDGYVHRYRQCTVNVFITTTVFEFPKLFVHEPHRFSFTLSAYDYTSMHCIIKCK